MSNRPAPRWRVGEDPKHPWLTEYLGGVLKENPNYKGNILLFSFRCEPADWRCLTDIRSGRVYLIHTQNKPKIPSYWDETYFWFQHVCNTKKGLSPKFRLFLGELFKKKLKFENNATYTSMQNSLTKKEDKWISHTELFILHKLYEAREEILAQLDPNGGKLVMYFASRFDVCDTCTFSLFQYLVTKILDVVPEIKATSWQTFKEASIWRLAVDSKYERNHRLEHRILEDPLADPFKPNNRRTNDLEHRTLEDPFADPFKPRQ